METNRERLESLPVKVLYLNAYLTQLILFVIAAWLYWIFRDSLRDVFIISQLQIIEALIWGSTATAVILAIEWVIKRIVSENALDDGGINKLLFSQMSSFHMICFCLLVSIVEELLFRAILQSLLGLFGASLLFAIIHVRYVTKPVLFLVVTGVSFILGLLFHYTGNILVPITAHFLINLISGFYIRSTNKKR